MFKKNDKCVVCTVPFKVDDNVIGIHRVQRVYTPNEVSGKSAMNVTNEPNAFYHAWHLDDANVQGTHRQLRNADTSDTDVPFPTRLESGAPHLPFDPNGSGSLPPLNKSSVESVNGPTLYSVLFFQTSGKWKYEDKLLFNLDMDYTSADPFRDYVNEALLNTPREMRQTTIHDCAQWIVVVADSPLGYPIMVKP